MERITNNFWWKLLSLCLSFLLWLIVVNVEDPLTTRTFYDIPVEKINVSVIESEKKAIEYREGEVVTVKVRGKRSVVDRMNYSDIIAFADLEKKSITGAVDIQIDIPENVSVLEKEPSMMMIELENIVTVQKEVQPYMEGEPGEGYIYLDPVVIPNNIEVEGPESKIALIKSVLVPVKIDGVTRDVTLYGTPQIIDESNNVILGLTKSSSQVQIQVPIEKTKTVTIKNDFDIKVAEGYELTGLTLSQDTVNIRGSASIIDKTDNLIISDIDISSLTEDTIIQIDVTALLGSGLNLYNDNETIELSVDVEPIVQKTIEINANDINVRQLASDLSFRYFDQEVYTLVYEGIQSKLDEITLESIQPSISVSGLDEGEHAIVLDIFAPSGVRLVSLKPIVTIELLKIESPVDENNEDPTEAEIITNP
jgi:YbbR domain-containing protein